MPDHPRVFISYSHDSDAHRERIRDLAARLRRDGLDAWIDQYSPVPAEGWPRWMKAEFARARFVVVVCSAGYAERFDRGPGHGSGVGWEAMLIQQELYEKGGNARFIPVFFDGAEQAVPTELRRFTRHALPTGYDALLRHLTGHLGEAPSLGPPPTSDPLPVAKLQSEGGRPGSVVRRIPWNVPSLPGQYLPREELDAVKLSLIAKNSQTIAVAGQHQRLGIQGMPGVGKTLLAAALAWDPEVQDAFPGGVYWLTLGRTPDPPVPWQAKLAAYLKGTPVEIDTPRLGKAKLAELFAARPPALLILDDVWRAEDADPFNALVFPSRLLITTRNRDVASGLGADVRELNELNSKAALALLATYAGRSTDALPRVAPDIVRECGELPLALAMAGSMLQGRPDDRWRTLLGQLQRADLEYLRATLPDYREHRNMLAAIEVSVQELPEDIRHRFLDFAVFAEDVAVPEAVLHMLWKATGVELAAVQKTVDVLVDTSLVRRDAEGRLTLHDLQHDYVRVRGGDLKTKHRQLLDAYGTVTPGQALHAVKPDGYFFEHIVRHVRDGEGTAALRALLFDHRWLGAKLKATGVNALLADFELLDLASDTSLRLLRNTIRLSAHVLSRHPEELFTQLLGRLRATSDDELSRFCARIDADANFPSILPLGQSLMSPEAALLCTLQGHVGEVCAVALSEDGKTAVSCSADKTLKVWDVETGQERRTLRGHADRVTAVALSGNGKVAVSGSVDKTLKVWDVETGQNRYTFKGHSGWVGAVALSGDGKTAVSGSWDGTLNVWNVETGQKRRTLRSRTGDVITVALSKDGKTAVSGSWDRTLRVWDVEAGKERRTLNGCDVELFSVALSADGNTAISGSSAETLKVWNVQTDQTLCTLRGHFDRVTAVGLSANGKTAVSSNSTDTTLTVWDVEAGQKRCTFFWGHTDRVIAVGLSADGKTVVSASRDSTLKIWNVAAREDDRIVLGRVDWVRAVGLCGDGKTAVSGSSDRTLKVWDVRMQQERRTLRSHVGWVTAVGLSADGKMAISGSNYGALKVWNVETGKKHRTFVGHLGHVTAVGLSADGKMAVSSSSDGTLKIWNVETGRRLRTLRNYHRKSAATLRVWNVVTGVARGLILATMAALGAWNVVTTVAPGLIVLGLAWLIVVTMVALGRLIVVGRRRARAGQKQHSLRDYSHWVTAVGLNVDGKTAIFSTADRKLKVWNVEAGREHCILPGHAGEVTAVALSADGKTAISSADDRTLKVWDVETGACIVSFTGDAAFHAIAFTREMFVFTADAAGLVHVLELRLGPDLPGRTHS